MTSISVGRITAWHSLLAKSWLARADAPSGSGASDDAPRPADLLSSPGAAGAFPRSDTQALTSERERRLEPDWVPPEAATAADAGRSGSRVSTRTSSAGCAAGTSSAASSVAHSSDGAAPSTVRSSDGASGGTVGTDSAMIGSWSDAHSEPGCALVAAGSLDSVT